MQLANHVFGADIVILFGQTAEGFVDIIDGFHAFEGAFMQASAHETCIDVHKIAAEDVMSNGIADDNCLAGINLAFL